METCATRGYRSVKACEELRVERIHSLYYFQFAPGDPLEGERHDFWELVYADAGDIQAISGDRRLVLRQGEMILHAPDQYHCLRLIPGCAANVFIISFSADCAALQTIASQPLVVFREQRPCLAHMLGEAARLYGSLLDCHRDLDTDRRLSAGFGSLQIIVNYLEILLIGELRRHRANRADGRLKPAEEGESPENTVRRLKGFMQAHLADNLSFADFCLHAGVSGTALKAAFRSENENGVMRCYQTMRIAQARKFLRSGSYNVTETAAKLGYASCQAFSAQFRRITGIAPSAYLRRLASSPEWITNRPGTATRHNMPML